MVSIERAHNLKMLRCYIRKLCSVASDTARHPKREKHRYRFLPWSKDGELPGKINGFVLKFCYLSLNQSSVRVILSINICITSVV